MVLNSNILFEGAKLSNYEEFVAKVEKLAKENGFIKLQLDLTAKRLVSRLVKLDRETFYIQEVVCCLKS